LALVLLGGHAGLREGELRELKWTDLNLQKGKVKIARAIWEDEVNLPKGGRVRELDLSETLRSALTAHHHRRGPYVLCHDDGAQLSVKVIYSLMRAAQRRAEMEDTGLVHILRHTFCSHLAMRGASAKAIQELAGHAQISTTMRYMHLSPAAKRSTVLLLDQVKPEGERGAAS
jgi:site-specific recombinase XerD